VSRADEYFEGLLARPQQLARAGLAPTPTPSFRQVGMWNGAMELGPMPEGARRVRLSSSQRYGRARRGLLDDGTTFVVVSAARCSPAASCSASNQPTYVRTSNSTPAIPATTSGELSNPL
jgi:hypothetical protein